MLCSKSRQFITWGSDQDKLVTMARFEERKLPLCLGAIDGCHIPIECPPKSMSRYRNRKGWHSIVLSAVCDFDRRFVMVDIGMPGRNHDAHVFRSSKMYGVARTHFGMSRIVKRIRRGDVDGRLKPYIIGDPAYPIAPSLIKGYPGGGLDVKQEYFNFSLSSGRMKIEQAFGLLKGRWKLFTFPSRGSLSSHVLAVGAACVLHNICIERMKERDDPDLARWRDDNAGMAGVPVGGEGELEQPQDVEIPDGLQGPRQLKREGERCRGLLAEYMFTLMPAGWRPPTWREGARE